MVCAKSTFPRLEFGLKLEIDANQKFGILFMYSLFPSSTILIF